MPREDDGREICDAANMLERIKTTFTCCSNSALGMMWYEERIGIGR